MMNDRSSVKPHVSVVICTYNRADYIGAALESLVKQKMPASQYEIIVVDNSSSDNTSEIVKDFIRQYGNDFHIRYVLESRRGLSFARNRGADEAAAPIVCYIDDDAIAVPDYVAEVDNFFSAHPEAAGAGGRVQPQYPDGEPAWMNKYLNGFIGKVEFGEETKKFTGPMKFPAGCNMIYQKKWIQQAGGFNNELTFRSDDKYIFYQIAKLNPDIYYLPKAKVFHHIDSRRLEFQYFKTLFLKTGNEEKIRVRAESGTTGYLKKLAEYLIKAGASLAIYLSFAVRGQEIKGRYTFFSQWFTLRGFLRRSVFVR